MTGLDTHVGGLALPLALLLAIKKGRWEAPTRPQTFVEVFGDTASGPVFYSVRGMIQENVPGMINEASGFQGWSQEYLAKALGVREEGVGITPSLAVLIGDLGLDSPIALDYRQSRSAPRVLYLHPAHGWVEVAPDIETLLRKLGIDWRRRAVVQRLGELPRRVLKRLKN